MSFIQSFIYYGHTFFYHKERPNKNGCQLYYMKPL